MSKVNCIQPSMTKARVIIELKSQAYVEELVSEHSSKHTVEQNNKEYAIPIVPYDNAIEVRIADLPSYFSTEMIAKHLAPYGEVVSTQEEVWKNFWPGLSTGVRLLRMRIRKPIPSYIPMTTHTAYITYRNQIRTCRYCVRPLHIGRTCNEARKEQGQDINSRLTAAQVVQGVIPPSSSNVQTNVPQPSSDTPSTENEIDVQTSDEEMNDVTNTNLVTPPTDRVMRSSTKAQSRPSSLSRFPSACTQTAKPSRTTSPPSNKATSDNQDPTADFVISDDSEEALNAPKRHRSQQPTENPETPFLEIKRKSRSRTHNSSSR